MKDKLVIGPETTDAQHMFTPTEEEKNNHEEIMKISVYLISHLE